MEETDFISLKALEKAKRKQRLVFGLMGAFAAVFAIFVVIAAIYQTRATQYIWIAAGTFASVLFLLAEAYVLLMVLEPLRAYMRFSFKALSRTRYLNRVRIIGTKKKTETYLGLPTYILEVAELDEGNVWSIRYPIGFEGFDPEIGEEYEIETFDEVLLKARKL